MRTSQTLPLRSVLLVLLLTILQNSSIAQTEKATEVPGAPHLLPEDTLLYARIDNADEFREAMRQSSVGQMMNDPKLKPFAGDIYNTFSELFEQISAEVGVSLDELLAIPSGQVAAAMMPGNLPTEDVKEASESAEKDESDDAIRRRIAQKRREQNSLAGLFLVEAGDNVDKMLAIVKRMEERLTKGGYVRRVNTIDKVEIIHLMPPRPGRPEIEYFEHQNTVVLGIGHQTAEKALDHWLGRSEERTLAESANFGNIMSRCIGAEMTRPQISFYADPYHIVERIVKRGGSAAFLWPILEELGISKIRGVGGSSFSGEETFQDINHLHVLIDSPRDGFFGVLRPEIVEPTPPNWVPSDVTAYMTFQWNLVKAYENLDKILSVFQGESPLKRLAEEPLEKRTGIKIQEDILSNLTGRYVSATWLQKPVKLNSQVTARAFELKDAEAAKAVIARFREKQPNEIQVETIAGTVVYVSSRGGRNVPESLRQPEPCFAIIDKWFVFGDSREFMTRLIQSNTGSLDRLIEVSEFDLVVSELGGKLDGEKPYLVSFYRGSDYFRMMYELAKSEDSRQFLRRAGEKNPVAKTFSDLMQRNALPPYEEFEKYFAPGGVFAYDDLTGIHMGSFNLKPE